MEYATTFASFDPMTGPEPSKGEMRGKGPVPVPPGDGWRLVFTNTEFSRGIPGESHASEFPRGRVLLVWTWCRGQSVAT